MKNQLINRLKDNGGSTLMECLASLSIISLCIVTLLGMSVVILQSKTLSEEFIHQGDALMNLYSEMEEAAKASPDKSKDAVTAAMLSVLQKYPGFRCEITAETDSLYDVSIIYTEKSGKERRYCGKISSLPY